MKLSHYTFNELSKQQLYDLLKLRSSIFIVEQKCIYQDIDNKDINAIHILVESKNRIIGYSRILKKGVLYSKYCVIGRVLIDINERNNKLGEQLMRYSIKIVNDKFKKVPIKISAQSHLKIFYEKQGFIYKKEDYLEDGIPHCAMYLN